LFVTTPESSAHQNFKQAVVEAGDGATQLTLKELTPVRLIKNKFFKDLEQAYEANADVKELQTLLGRGRAKKGMFEGDLQEGELEIGQVSATIHQIKPAAQIVQELLSDYNACIVQLKPI
jgi:enoyl-[acyl-carrier protein] reductase II